MKKILKSIKEVESCFNKKTGTLYLYPHDKDILNLLNFAKQNIKEN